MNKIDIERALTIHGWMSEVELEYLATIASTSKSIVEIGSWVGRSTCAIASNTSGTVFAVDTWEGGYEQGKEFEGATSKWIISEFSKNTYGLDNIVPMRTTSLEAAAAFKSQDKKFDMVFIDAKHDYESITADILAWFPLVREGGILCGHDYHFHWQGIKDAVDLLVPKFSIVDTIWTTDVVKNKTGE